MSSIEILLIGIGHSNAKKRLPLKQTKTHKCK